MAELTMIEAIRDALALELARDERVLVMGEDVGHLGGVFRATDGLRQRFSARRVIDTPLAESVIVGSAYGLALTGFVPVVEIQFAGFTQNAFHQICQQVARSRFRTRGAHPVQMTIRTPFGGNVRTPEFHSDSMEAVFAQSTGLKIVMPSTAYDAKGLLLEAIRDPDPVMFFEPLRGYRSTRDEVPLGDYTVPFGQLRVVREGTDVTLVTWSASVPVAAAAAAQLADEGISVQVVDLRTLVPLDEAGLVAAVERTGRCVVLHEGPAAAGFGAEVIALLQGQAFYSLEAPLLRVTAPDVPYPMPGVEHHYIPDADKVVRAVRSVLVD
ncbi:MAG: alpha-ketoacid dehydrogenase subunit beta [Gammaproteobacteria bacterium]|nr:alpha-ketoacid dehydrogenase subunit beta [Gammaproteobacteria bacterium]